MSEGPVDPLSALAESTAEQHELFMAYVESGFTRPEALKIIIAILTHGNGG